MRYYRYKIQAGFLSPSTVPDEKELTVNFTCPTLSRAYELNTRQALSNILGKLETNGVLPESIIRAIKIDKVLRAVLRLPSVPGDDEHHFKHRVKILLTKWQASRTNGSRELQIARDSNDGGSHVTSEPNNPTIEERPSSSTIQNIMDAEPDDIITTPHLLPSNTQPITPIAPITSPGASLNLIDLLPFSKLKCSNTLMSDPPTPPFSSPQISQPISHSPVVESSSAVQPNDSSPLAKSHCESTIEFITSHLANPYLLTSVRQLKYLNIEQQIEKAKKLKSQARIREALNMVEEKATS